MKQYIDSEQQQLSVQNSKANEAKASGARMEIEEEDHYVPTTQANKSSSKFKDRGSKRRDDPYRSVSKSHRRRSLSRSKEKSISKYDRRGRDSDNRGYRAR